MILGVLTVILSGAVLRAAKDLDVRKGEILRCTQDDVHTPRATSDGEGRSGTPDFGELSRAVLHRLGEPAGSTRRRAEDGEDSHGFVIGKSAPSASGFGGERMYDGGVKRLGRWASTILVAVSLVLSLAVAAMWMRSYWVVDSLRIQSQTRFFELESRCGQIEAEDTRVLLALQYKVHFARYWKSYRPATRGFANFPWDVPATARLGFSYRSKLTGTPPVFDVRQLRIPYWAIFFVASTMTGGCFKVVLSRRRRARRFGAGLCPTCSYDLRATPDRCPECGTVASRLAAAQKEHPA
jgi:hypothetical protein